MENESVGISIFLSSYAIPAMVKEVDFLLVLKEIICSAKKSEEQGCDFRQS